MPNKIFSVVICTFNRCLLLKRVLDSLIHQSLSQEYWELIIIDDGSNDQTQSIVESFHNTLPLTYRRQNNAGLASAKNHGIFAATGNIIFFMDDDDYAHPYLLKEHFDYHFRFPHENHAILGLTELDPALKRDLLLHYVTEIGCFLYAYPSINHDQFLDFTYFWGGRTSFKRTLLLKLNFLFDPIFKFGCEDIELGFRLQSRSGLNVIFNKNAVSYTFRKITYSEFCNRLERQGRSNYLFSKIHSDLVIQNWCESSYLCKYWVKHGGFYDRLKTATLNIEASIVNKLNQNASVSSLEITHLYKFYSASFTLAKAKGFYEAIAIENSC